MDKRLGKFAEDGSIEQWPEIDLNGGDYSRGTARLARFGCYFAVLPPRHLMIPLARWIADARQQLEEIKLPEDS